MKSVLRPIIAALCGTAVCAAILFGKGILSADSSRETMRILSDAFTVPGLVLLLCGLFVWILRQGTFSGMGYALKQLYMTMRSEKYREEHKESFSDYRERKQSRKPPFLFLIVTGCVFLVPGILFSILYFFV